jgi:hypothetical protein
MLTLALFHGYPLVIGVSFAWGYFDFATDLRVQPKTKAFHPRFSHPKSCRQTWKFFRPTA